MRKREIISGICAATGIMILILDGKTALSGAQEGIELCLKTVIPSLFPFFVLSIFLTGMLTGTSILMLMPLGKLFSLPPWASSLLIPAFLGGYPVGAQCVAQGFRSGNLSRDHAQRMLSFCSNAGPSFLFGMVGSMFPNRWYAWALWGIHICSACLVSMVFPCHNVPGAMRRGKTETLSSSMGSAVSVMLQVCGWVILFRVCIAFLDRWLLWLLPDPVRVALIGLLELSNGCCELMAVENVPLRFVLCSGMLACGGLCVTMQTASVTAGLSLKYYAVGKGLQTLFSILFSVAIIFGYWWIIPCCFGTVFLFSRKNRKNSSNPALVGV